MFSKLWGWLAGLGTLIAGVLGFAAYFKHQGKKDEQAADTERALQEAKDASEIDAKVRALSDDDIAKQLRDVQRPK